MPNFILYTDGQLLFDAGSLGYETKTFSVTQMCALLADIAQTGFFQVDVSHVTDPKDDPIYKFDASTQFSDGAFDEVIQVNGNPANEIGVYEPYEPYLISPVKAALRVMKNYRPTGLKPYQADKLLLWIEPGRGDQASWGPSVTNDATQTATPQVQPWPANLPRLADLLAGAPSAQVYIQGDLVAPILQLPSNFGVYTDQGQEYFVIVRPLLPDETADYYSDGPRPAQAFDLPFKCGG